MKLHWLVPSLIGFFWLAAPAEAGQLTTWQFNARQNQLEFATDGDVQPRAQLVFAPTRLVIDLPGTQIGEIPESQMVGGAIQQVRIGQFDDQTTRIVVELAPGYTLDPQQIRFRGLSPTQWTVQLPQPQPTEAAMSEVSSPAPTSSNRPSSGRASSGANATPPVSPASTSARARTTATESRSATEQSTPPRTPSASRSATRSSSPPIAQIDAIQVTDEGLFVSTEATDVTDAKVSIERSRSRRSVTIRIENARLSRALVEREREIDRHGIDDLEIEQDADDVVEIKLDVARRSPDWQARVGEDGILLLPETAVAEGALKTAADPEPPASASTRSNSANPTTERTATERTVAEQPSPARPSAAASEAIPRVQMATIQGIDLDLSGNQLLIQTDRPVTHQAQWQSGLYVITLSPARLAERVTGPQLTPADPLRRVRLRQTDDQTVIVTVQPGRGVQFGVLNLITPQMLALEIQRSIATSSRSAASSLQLAPNSSNRSFPNVVPNGRLVVVIDPGHGGADVGAVGIGNLYEANVVLPIAQQVASLLQQQGVQVLLTRNSDVEIDLEPRVQMAEQANASLFVSIHANSMGMDRPDVNGAETYYYSNGAALAETIQNSMISSLGMTDRGVRQARFYVLRKTSMPAVLVETGFVTGSEDAPRLADANFRNQMAIAIARGILQYIQQQAFTGSR